MSEINGILIFILLAVALMQKTSERLYVAVLFAILAGIHHIALYSVEGIAYYGSAALVDFSVIFFTYKLRVLSKAIKAIQDICIASILLNGIGWVMWMTYMPPHAYNAMFIALYSWAIITLLRKDAADDYGSTTVGGRHNNIHPAASKGSYISQEFKETS